MEKLGKKKEKKGQFRLKQILEGEG